MGVKPLSVGTGKIVNSHTNDSPSDTLLVCVRQARARSHVATIHAQAARSSVCLVEVCARARGLCERDGSEQCCRSHDLGGHFHGPRTVARPSFPCGHHKSRRPAKGLQVLLLRSSRFRSHLLRSASRVGASAHTQASCAACHAKARVKKEPV